MFSRYIKIFLKLLKQLKRISWLEHILLSGSPRGGGGAGGATCPGPQTSRGPQLEKYPKIEQCPIKIVASTRH